MARVHRPVLAAVLLVVVACAATPSRPLALENGTDIPLAVHLDGAWVGTYAPGSVAEVPIEGELPHRIEVRSGSGAVLSSLEVSEEDARAIEAATRSIRATSDTPCGVIRLTMGDAAVEPMPAGTSAPGPCP